MCTDCGCNINKQHTILNKESAQVHTPHREPLVIDMHRSLLFNNDQQAVRNRELLAQHNITAINLMSSPGSGKTTLLERTIDERSHHCRIAVIEGDLETENDARRIRAKGVEAIQVTTGNACHLDATMVDNALQQLDLTQIDLLFIENVGNLVCPASFDLGQHRNVTLLSTTEGDDKPEKYPVIFRASDLMLLTKSDLLPLLDDFDPQRAAHSLASVAGTTLLLQLSAKTGDGFTQWLAWLNDSQKKVQLST